MVFATLGNVLFFPGGKGEIRKLEREIGRLEERIADLEIDVKYLSSDKDTLQAKIYVSLA